MKKLPGSMTQWFGAALEAYKLKTRKRCVDADVTLAIHEACQKGFNAISGIESNKEAALTAALEGDPLQDVILTGYISTTRRSTLVDLYVP